MLTLLVELNITTSIKYLPKQNITVLSSIANGFFNILTTEIVNDIQAAQSNRRIKSSQQLSTITENPLDESFNISDDQPNTLSNRTGIISPPLFFTKRPN